MNHVEYVYNDGTSKIMLADRSGEVTNFKCFHVDTYRNDDLVYVYTSFGCCQRVKYKT